MWAWPSIAGHAHTDRSSCYCDIRDACKIVIVKLLAKNANYNRNVIKFTIGISGEFTQEILNIYFQLFLVEL